MRAVFFGTPSFAATILKYLLEKGVEVVAVVTKPDKPQGRYLQPRFSPVKELALERALPLYQPPKASAPEFASVLKELKADLFIVAAYAEILKENLLEMPLKKCINVHASILPKYRGAAPVQRAIMEGEKETGVTIMQMAKELDAGGILSIVKTAITDQMTAGELMEKLAILGAVALYEVIEKLDKGTVAVQMQDPAQVTYAKKISIEDTKISWNRPAFQVHNQIRGVTPHPGAWCLVEIKGVSKRLLIKKGAIESQYAGKPGEILSKNGSELVIGCSQGAFRILELQIEGKKKMASDEFLRGIQLANLNFII